MRLKTAFPILSLVVAVSLVIFLSCHKGDASVANNSSSQTTIAKARQYFEANILIAPPPADARPNNPWTALHKTPNWAMASIARMNPGDPDNVVVVPVSIKEGLTLKRNSGNLSISAGLLTYLLMYPDEKDGYHVEVPTEIPDDSYVTDQREQKSYTGMIRVQDWQGNFLKAYHIKNGAIDKQYASSSMGSTSSTNVKTPAFTEDCSITDWYNCFSLDGGQNYTCNWDHETEDCAYSSGDFGTNYIYQLVYKYIPNSGGGDWIPNPGWQICTNLSFSTDANGNYVLNLNNLQCRWTSATQGTVSFAFPNTCVTIPSSGISQLYADSYFSNAYNDSQQQLQQELNKGTTAPVNAMSRFITLVQTKFATHGGSWDPYENCSQSAVTISDSECSL